MDSIISIKNLAKTYANGFVALKSTNLEIRRGEIFAMLGPNGAGKTTLINIVCGIVNATSGQVTVDGHDIVRDARAARSLIGLVPQELTTDAFETVWDTTTFSRGLFGKPRDPAHVEGVLKSLSLWDKKDDKIMTLSGGMKRRVMIAKALAHEPQILFLDEPTAGVDVELRQDMWNMVRGLRDSGVTIILTTHYIEEAEEMADRDRRDQQGRDHPRRGEDRAHAQARQEAAHAAAASAARGAARVARRATRSSCTRAARSSSTPTTRRASARASRRCSRRSREAGIGFKDLQHDAELARGDLREPRLEEDGSMNWHAIRAIYAFEMARTWRTLVQSIVAPVLSTSLYFVVFGSAIGSRIQQVERHELRRVHRAGADDAVAADREHLQRVVRHLHAALRRHDLRGAVGARLRRRDRARLRRRGRDQVGDPRASSSSRPRAVFVPLHIAHPIWMLLFLVLTAVTFSLFGFIIGVWADSFEKLQIVPMLIVTPLTFLGGSFYSISMLPPVWQKITLFNPVVYLVSGFRWSFYELADVRVEISVGMTAAFMLICLATAWWILTTGYRLKK